MRISKKIKVLFPIAVAFSIVGCVQQPQALYNYGDYSDSYYANKKNMSDESTLKLQQSMEQAIEKAGESISGRVPPGMYANLGYMYLKSGNPNGAISNFKKEKSVYPESARFMDRIIKKVELVEGKLK
ncbi:DUF4810 domain-containing protein [Candidatus Sulfurimonas marisnigri]|uniref:DUF4810 domain-containing protein n=1 Tax=Candidatus Sulfurimonas marisnigri TaxID=2740405 RepID=A0A7S7M1D2_9BACT|nr:DUF4810 domain-containing protein [Candidatus Sulfurimonas marisnigri]QOY55254.1 DUF4810 domain-containing protein [Candidatus Sulfurimonas marisnigri]